MGKSLTEICRVALEKPIDLLDACIDNCPDSLWNKTFAGESYWRHIYHALAAVWVFFPCKNKNCSDSTELSNTKAATLGSEYTQKIPDKKILKQVVREAKQHLTLYFEDIKDSILFAEVEFSGRQLLLIELVVTASRHGAYNVGICEALLRDNGAQTVVVQYNALNRS
jgi:hypothetical protein